MSSVMKKKIQIRKIKAGTVLLCLLFTFGGMPVYAEEVNNSDILQAEIGQTYDNIFSDENMNETVADEAGEFDAEDSTKDVDHADSDLEQQINKNRETRSKQQTDESENILDSQVNTADKSEENIQQNKQNADFFTGLRKESDGIWYYLVDGAVQDTYTGLVQHSTGSWYYVKDGVVQFDANGLVKHTNNVLYYVQNGRLKSNYTALVKHTDGIWYYVVNGKVQNDYTGLAKHTTGSWYYVQKGKIQFNITGLVKHSTGSWYYVISGKMQGNFNGLVKHTNGTWYYIENGKKIENYTGLAKHTTGSWYYVKNGKMQNTYTGLAKHITGSWYYVKNGKMQNTYTGLAKHITGTWYYIEKGKWNSSFNGLTKYDGKYYNVKNGKKYGGSVTTSQTKMLQKAQQYSSNTRWLILVDTNANKVGVFTGARGAWSQKYYWSCTTGASSTPTVKGQFTVGMKGLSFGSGYTCWYYTQFYGNYLFHSVLYNPGSMTSIQDGRLGINASHGCVRLNLENAKWIYNNIPTSTKVVVY